MSKVQVVVNSAKQLKVNAKEEAKEKPKRRGRELRFTRVRIEHLVPKACLQPGDEVCSLNTYAGSAEWNIKLPLHERAFGMNILFPKLPLSGKLYET